MEENKEKWYDLKNRNCTDNSIDDKQVVFRVITFDRLLQMFNDEANTLVNIKLWEDTYENFILKESLIYKGMNDKFNYLSNCYYGQCWTRRMASDAIWRIYSPDKKSVRIKTTIGKLREMTKEQSDGTFLINKVKYYSQKQIQDDISDLNVVKEDDFKTLINQSLFVKRNSFSHESEYRIIFYTDHHQDNDVRSFHINPYHFIDNIYFDPRVDDAYVERCKNILIKTYHFPKKRIYKSSLYSFKPQDIVIE